MLRARVESDVAVLHEELYGDVETRAGADSRAWRPVPVESGQSPYRVEGPVEDAAVFSVVERAGGELVGEAVVWGIDQHNRVAHLGLALRPAFRGRGLGADAVRVMCRYGFEVRGLQRLQVETLARNAAMIAAAERSGFVREGVLRRSAWVLGRFEDEAVLGLLAAEWSGGRG
ncbi:putative acetyltransferase [Kitasatospora setae KM-6054]|uniref:Putative acetyltransferase n=1 Tax=Kitasatospora setae (strain ATCC 33774 / DSM 43861 / JCM 3304 / KCC A-0304 / NBRC 14216 / KM-6054) TaxID=452652 RepID=E4N322_KITSK|nr:putative acetyltransferase [Kitasatospora setae KM-6054]